MDDKGGAGVVYVETGAAWRPIATAPKDGTEIIGYRADHGVFTLRWADADEFAAHSAGGDPLGRCEEFSYWWHDRWGWLEGELQPTHWMPLPAPPATTTQEQTHD